MAISRNAAVVALFARLQAKVTLCTTFGRKWKPPQEIGADQQPALLLLEGPETPEDQPPNPPVWTMELEVAVYVRTNDLDAPGALLSNILDQIESALELQPTEGVGYFAQFHTNLGIRNVQRAWISGTVDKEDGSNTGGQGWLLVPVSIRIVA